MDKEGMARLEVIFGPPGCGKTTELARLAQHYAEHEGSDTLLLCAFTRTAAQELATRGLNVERRQIGTLHSLCFHGMERPALAETHIKEWNESHGLYVLSLAQSMTEMDTGPIGTHGDICLNEVNVARHRGLPAHRLSSAAHLFWNRWHAWKRATGYLDYTDLIARARTLLPVAPSVSQPYTLIVDEAQDMSLLQWSLLAQWARHALRFIAAGDDDQALYRWAGADVRPMLAARSRRVLPQSYRVPQCHQALALAYCHKIHTREPKTWLPRMAPGFIQHLGYDWHNGAFWVAEARRWLTERTEGSITFLASCSYMLQPLLANLRRVGIPFGNRWRTKRHDWNPLLLPRKGVGMVQRILDFLKSPERLWTWRELGTWAPYLLRSEETLLPHAKAVITARASDNGVCDLATLQQLFLPHALQGALTGGLEWLKSMTLRSRIQALEYPALVYKYYGPGALTDEPRIRIGTAHSFKGTESDTVVYFTDLSRSQRVALCEGGDAADDVWRMRYVAATRSRDTLILAGGNLA